MYFGLIACPAGSSPFRIVLVKSDKDQRESGPPRVRSVPAGAPGSGPWPPARSRPWQNVQPPTSIRYLPSLFGGLGRCALKSIFAARTRSPNTPISISRRAGKLISILVLVLSTGGRLLRYAMIAPVSESVILLK